MGYGEIRKLVRDGHACAKGSNVVSQKRKREPPPMGSDEDDEIEKWLDSTAGWQRQFQVRNKKRFSRLFLRKDEIESSNKDIQVRSRKRFSRLLDERASSNQDEAKEEVTPKPEPVIPSWALDMYKKTKEALALEQAGQEPEDEGRTLTEREMKTEEGDITEAEPDPNVTTVNETCVKMIETPLNLQERGSIPQIRQKPDEEGIIQTTPTGHRCTECKVSFMGQYAAKLHLLYKHGIDDIK